MFRLKMFQDIFGAKNEHTLKEIKNEYYLAKEWTCTDQSRKKDISISYVVPSCLQPSDKPKLVQYARKIDLMSSPFGQLMISKV